MVFSCSFLQNYFQDIQENQGKHTKILTLRHEINTEIFIRGEIGCALDREVESVRKNGNMIMAATKSANTASFFLKK
jgi:hypothetical protein